ncbi:MAG: alpha-L-fucosidase [Phycisphaerae bacterium]|nr:alpha-L-fucosidase [Phycisphaerae bacterium]
MAAVLLASGLTGTALAADDAVDPYARETREQRDARMKWWREARFGMFIHWGVYSVPAGTYHDKRIGGIGEWIMNSAKIPCAEYQGFAKQFNPVKYNADEWVRMAKDAGMKYIVITSKHHDGFALFQTRASKWNVVDATPYGKDLLKPLAAACAKHGLRLGFYYSQAQDWNNPGGAAAGGHWDKAQDGSMDDYIRNVAVPQVKEILLNYGDLSILWWDTPVDMNRERAEMLIPLLKLRPGIIHNNRLGGGYHGDTETPEQFIPPTGYPGGRDWETCMTMNDTWGFKSYDNNWKSTETLVRNLVDIASKGGNYLLNIGPTSEGLFPEASVERLKEVGRWMKTNGESIYSTSASPFRRLPWGRCTKKVGSSETTLYLHVFQWPSDGRLVVPGLKNKVLAAALLADPKKELKHESSEAGVMIEVPTAAPDAICSVVTCRIEGQPDVEAAPIMPGQDGSITLPAVEANLHGQELRYEPGESHDNIGYWTKGEDFVDWQFRVKESGKYKVTATIAALASGTFEVSVGDAHVQGTSPKTGSYTKFETVEVGILELTAGISTLTVKPAKEGWQAMNLRSLTLTPMK